MCKWCHNDVSGKVGDMSWKSCSAYAFNGDVAELLLTYYRHHKEVGEMGFEKFGILFLVQANAFCADACLTVQCSRCILNM